MMRLNMACPQNLAASPVSEIVSLRQKDSFIKFYFLWCFSEDDVYYMPNKRWRFDKYLEGHLWLDYSELQNTSISK
jgi:hypothetical protein